MLKIYVIYGKENYTIDWVYFWSCCLLWYVRGFLFSQVHGIELIKKEQLLNASDFNLLSNNVKGLQSSKRRLKLFHFFESKISPKGILFLKETHYLKVTEKIWYNELNGDLFFSKGKTNSCGVLVGFYGNINYSVIKELSDNGGGILVLDVATDGTKNLLITLYNWNTEWKQLKILDSLSKVLNEFQDISEKNIIFAREM